LTDWGSIKNGIITYVNKPLEEISGFSSKELIGKTHSIMKHEETKKEVFKDMWNTLLNKKVWSGIIKNKKKNGDYYITDTLIKPILDIDNNIVEFIALRNDITDLEMSKEYFKSETINVKSNLKESIKREQAYKDAINKTNMILTIKEDRTISYVNDAFCELSGYTKKELMGSPYSIIKDKRISDEEYNLQVDEFINIIKRKELCRIKVSNTAKDGSLFHCDLTFFPLAGDFEYLGIRHDVTELENLYEELEETQREVIYKLGEIGETRSKETGNHVKRVALYSKILAEKIGLSKEESNILFTSSPMHDIGKVGIPDSILNKPGKLTSEEWTIMQTHSEIGYEILKSSTRPILKAAAIVSYTHHEKWNGSGYPLGLKGENIHIYGRITALADVFDALGSARCYKKAWPLEKILDFFNNQKGKHFEPKLIEIFMDNLDEFIEIRNMYEDKYE
jgi:PAS domain S-box-containing protein